MARTIKEIEESTVVLDGKAVIRVAQKLVEALEGESLPIVMQAIGLVLSRSTDYDRDGHPDIAITTPVDAN